MLKFLSDRILALVGLVTLSPVFLAVALLIRIRMPDGPVLFHQERIGKDGKPFRMVKFRTMTGNQAGDTVTCAGDPRVTPLGAWLRRNKLDELPELWNVLVGEMSFVGPRPDVPGYADALTGDDREILRLRPGITGPATLKYRNEEELLASVDDPVRYNDEVIFPDKVRINRYYLHHWSPWTDLRILWATVFNRKITFGDETI